MPAATEETTGPKRPIRTLVDCPKCGASNPADARHCQNCGASMAGAGEAVAEEATEKKKGFLGKLLGKRS